MNPSSTDAITDDLHDVNSRCEAKTEEEIVAEPLPTDVLFGRDKQMFNHVGNVRFRLVIQARAKEYEFAPSRRVKSSIVYAVVQNVHSYGGRFLKKEDGKWKVVGVTEAIQKVGHALRDKKQHDHKMKARSHASFVDPQPLKNNCSDSSCALLVNMNQADHGIEHASHSIEEQHTSSMVASTSMNNSQPNPANNSKRKAFSFSDTSSFEKKTKTNNLTDPDITESTKLSRVHEDDNSAAEAILALGGHPDSRRTNAKPNKVLSDLFQNDSSKSEKDASCLPEARPLNSSDSITSRDTDKILHSTHPQLLARSDPQPSTYPDAHTQRITQQLQHLHQFSTAINGVNHHSNNEGASSALFPPGFQGNTCHPDTLRPPQPYSSRTQAVLQAHQIHNLIHAAAIGSGGGGGGLGFANHSHALLHGQQQGILSGGDEREATTTQPPIIYTNKGDDDGHWIFYPIKVPKMKLMGLGWKLALIPIDGKGKPIELDPSSFQFPECS